MKLALALFLLPIAPQHAIEPIRVTLSAPSNEVNEALGKSLRAELLKLGDVAISEKRGDYLIQFDAGPIVGCDGYVAAVVVAERETHKASLEAYSGPTLEQVARYIVGSVNRDSFAQRRGRTVGKK